MIQPTPSSNRLHITFLGRCNSGKSSLINALTGQSVSIVSDEAGTTTDPVSKPIELPGVGACLLIDTAGIDDNSSLGELRIAKTRKVLEHTDVAILLFSDSERMEHEQQLLKELRLRETPVIAVVSQCDRINNIDRLIAHINQCCGLTPIAVSAINRNGLYRLREAIALHATTENRLITDSVCDSGDTVLLVMPQDSQAPKGRLIKPQAEVLRELLDRGCTAICCTPARLPDTLASLSTPPRLIITDSQAFGLVRQHKPDSTSLTSFSILFARYKGDLDTFIDGAKSLSTLSSSSRVLIAEACTHAPQHEDIGRVKLPRLLRKKIDESLHIDIVAGNDFPDDLSSYDLVIHCGACMFNRRHVMNRIARAKAQNVPITNYGIVLSELLR